MVIVVAILLVAVLLLMCNSHKVWSQERTVLRFYAFYIDLEMEVGRGLMFPVVFLARRLLVAYVLVYGTLLAPQVFAMQMLSVFCFAYVKTFRAFAFPDRQMIELINEVLLLMITTTLFWYTEHYSRETRYKCGWVYIVAFMGDFFFNIGYFIYHFFTNKQYISVGRSCGFKCKTLKEVK